MSGAWLCVRGTAAGGALRCTSVAWLCAAAEQAAMESQVVVLEQRVGHGCARQLPLRPRGEQAAEACVGVSIELGARRPAKVEHVGGEGGQRVPNRLTNEAADVLVREISNDRARSRRHQPAASSKRHQHVQGGEQRACAEAAALLLLLLLLAAMAAAAALPLCCRHMMDVAASRTCRRTPRTTPRRTSTRWALRTRTGSRCGRTRRP